MCWELGEMENGEKLCVNFGEFAELSGYFPGIGGERLNSRTFLGEMGLYFKCFDLKEYFCNIV